MISSSQNRTNKCLHEAEARSLALELQTTDNHASSVKPATHETNMQRKFLSMRQCLLFTVITATKFAIINKT